MGECFVCQEDTKIQKFLDCGTLFKHKLCVVCIEKLTKTTVSGLNGEKLVECPLCRQKTILPNGDARKLLTKFYAKLTCEDCSDQKEVGEQWWCLTCETTICSKCAMVRHRQHECSHWENYDVPKECLLFFKKRLKESDNKNVLNQKVQNFCRQLEKCLMKKIETAYNFNFYIDNIEKCFGNLTVDEKKLFENNDVTNVEKKWRSTLDLIKFTQNCSDVETEELLNYFNEIGTAPFQIPALEDVLKLFNKPARDVVEKSTNAQLESASNIVYSFIHPQILHVQQPDSPSSSINQHAPLWLTQTKRQASPRVMELKDVKWCSCESSAGKYDWDVSWKFNFAFGLHNNLYYVDGSRLLYFHQNGEDFKVSNIVRLSSDPQTEMCPSQIVYNTVRKALFITVQVNDENKIGSLMEFYELNLVCVNLTKLPMIKGYQMKGNSLHLLTVLNNGTLVILVTDGVKMYIYLKFIKLMNRDQCDRVFENVSPKFIANDVPLEELCQMRSHFFEENKEMLVISGKKSIYCFSVIKHKIQLMNFLQNVFANGFSNYCFSNGSSLFIADFSRSKMREIQPTKFDCYNVKESGMDNVEEHAPILATSALNGFLYVIKPRITNGNFCKHCVIIYKVS